MSTEQNKALARHFYEEVWKKKNLGAIDALCSPDFVDHSAPPGFPPGAEGVKQLLGMYLAALSDLEYTFEHMIAEGDKVATRYVISFTHTGDLMGIAPTGKRVTFTGTEIFRIVGGKLAERWEDYDQYGMMQQLGAIPPME